MEDYLLPGLYILTLIIWVWALIDLFKTRYKNAMVKGLWLIAILFFPVIGSLVYFQYGKKSSRNERRKFQPDFNRLR